LAEPKTLSVSFPSARELLNAYWGLLANGGLVLPSRQGLREGDKVDIEVTIETSGQRCHLKGQVVRRPPHDPGAPDRVVIAFDPGEPQDMLLSAAWAEIENVPARRQRRFPLDVDIRFASTTDGSELSGRLVNLSLGGCCLRVPRAQDGKKVQVGAPLTLISPSPSKSTLAGVVKWSDGSCRGIEFEGTEPAMVESFVRQFI
jgi:Tfp pilus assembly protein PilZ